jgi:two-component system, NarL family, response regulator NreC
VTLSVVLIDDHRLFRDGLRTLIEQQGDLKVVGEAEDARNAYPIIESTHPDVVLMDVALTSTSGIATTRELLRRMQDVRVLMLSMHGEADFVSQALSAGANGYALKTQSSGEILDAIRAVARGEMYLSPLISRTVVEDGLKLKRGENGQAGPCHELSPREREVFDLLVRGFSNDSIAQSLCISVKTVETHRARILKKLKLHSLVELVRFAARHDLICE